MKTAIYILMFILYGVSAVLLTQCGSTIENEDTIIAISGHVMKNSGNDTVGAPGVEVRLVKVGLSDSTDKNGFYSIRATPSSLDTLGFSIDNLQDSIIMTNNGKIVYKEKVERWIDTLPTVYLIQRDIHGTFNTNAFNQETTIFSKIDIIIRYSDGPPADSTFIRAYYFKETGAYSCFAYFQNAGTAPSREFTIYARVYDSSGRFIGQSRTLRFNNSAGDIELPVFNPFNALPKCNAGNDTTVSISDTLKLSASAVDSFGRIVRREWDAPNTGNFIAFDSGRTVFIKTPATPANNFLCILRVTDNDSNSVLDTLRVTVVQDIPVVSIRAEKTIVPIDSLIILHATGSDRFGYIVKWEWDIGATGAFVQSTQDSTLVAKAPPTSRSNFLCVVSVTDDDGNRATDTIAISIVPPRSIGFAAVQLKDSLQSVIIPLYLAGDTRVEFGNDPIPGGSGAVRLDASSDSILWYCRSDGSLWEYENGLFRQNDIVIGSMKKAFDISVNLYGTAFVAGEGNLFYTYAGNQWLSKQGLVRRVDAAATDSLCGVIGEWGDVFVLKQESGWVQLGSLKAFEFSAGQKYYAISQDSILYQWNNSGSVWDLVAVPFAAGAKTRVETTMNDEVIIVDSKNAVYFRNRAGTWTTAGQSSRIVKILDVTLY